ncbi:MAG: nucleoside deaminase [Endomicrobium sp.]|nr:nucleoside deaminase [Endomicrobium sp.]
MTDNQNYFDTLFMMEALEEALKAFRMKEIPIGAVLVKNLQIIARGFNQCINKVDPTAHAEIIVLRKAAKKLNNYRLNNCAIYVTIEPCIMCMGAITNARLTKVRFGNFNNKIFTYNLKLELKKQFNYFMHDIRRLDNRILNLYCSTIIKYFLQQKRRKTSIGGV